MIGSDRIPSPSKVQISNHMPKLTLFLQIKMGPSSKGLRSQSKGSAPVKVNSFHCQTGARKNEEERK